MTTDHDERRLRLLRALARAHRYEQDRFVLLHEAQLRALDAETQEGA